MANEDVSGVVRRRIVAGSVEKGTVLIVGEVQHDSVSPSVLGPLRLPARSRGRILIAHTTLSVRLTTGSLHHSIIAFPEIRGLEPLRPGGERERWWGPFAIPANAGPSAT